MALFLATIFFIIMILIIYLDIKFNKDRNLYKIIMTFFIISSINIIVIMNIQGYIIDRHEKSNLITKTYNIEEYSVKFENDEPYLYFSYYENGKEYNERLVLNSFNYININNESGKILKYTYIPGNDNIWFPTSKKNISLSIKKGVVK